MSADKEKFSDIFSSNPPGLTEILGTKKAFVAGAGGLGSNVASMLVRAGLTNMIIADYDIIEPRNLNRQQFFFEQAGMKKVDALRCNLERIYPAAIVKTIDGKLDESNFTDHIPADVDIIFECFDSAASKAALVRFCLMERRSIPLVAVSGLGGAGPLEDIRLSKPGENFYLVGDGVSEADEKNGTLSTRVTFTAALQAHTGIRILCGLA